MSLDLAIRRCCGGDQEVRVVFEREAREVHFLIFLTESSSQLEDSQLEDSPRLSTIYSIHRYRRNINHLIYIIKEERSKYTDSILRTLSALYDEYDLDQAQAELSQFDVVSRADYFFSSNKMFSEQFKKSARQLIFRTYCLTHREIDMKALASKLEMELSQCEKWTVDLIQTEGSKNLNDAKIDTENGVAVMDVRYPSIYERIINKTRDLTMRSYDMAGTIGQM